MEERPPIWSVAANILNKQSRTTDNGWYSNLGVGRGGNNSSQKKPPYYETFTNALDKYSTDKQPRVCERKKMCDRANETPGSAPPKYSLI